jgi:hypothetical protein
MITIMVAFHAIFWPLHLVTYWTAAQMMAIDLLLCGWVAATGAWIALAIRTGTRRVVWCTTWMAVIVAGVVLDALGLQAPFPELAGPYAALLRLTPERTDSTALPVWSVAIWPWIMASAAWAGVLIGAKRLPRAPSPANL